MAEDGYRQSIQVRAPRERVWDAVGTVDGPRHWWTTVVSGSAEAGGQLRFGFAGLPEEMVGLPGDVVADGWRHFLASLAAYAEGGAGHPFGA